MRLLTSFGFGTRVLSNQPEEVKWRLMSSRRRRSLSSGRIRLLYLRLPDDLTDMYSELVYRDESVVVARYVTSTRKSVVFDKEVVLAAGYDIAYFELAGRWFTVCKIRNTEGKLTGYYCDIATPPRFFEDRVEQTDLFLDLWVFPDLSRHQTLDEDELETALTSGWIEKPLYDRAKQEIRTLICEVEAGGFPPTVVKNLEERLRL
jgi:predicted RNA-binding protein associated with RNAse of E/G family